MIIVFSLYNGDGNFTLIIKDVISAFCLASGDKLAAYGNPPLVIVTSSRICDIAFQPAFVMAGLMNFVQMSRSLRDFLSIYSSNST